MSNAKAVRYHRARLQGSSSLGLRTQAYLVRGVGRRAIKVINTYAPFEMTSRPSPCMYRHALAAYARVAREQGWKTIVVYLDRELQGFAMTNVAGYLQHLRDPGYCGVYPKCNLPPQSNRPVIPLPQA